jgi:hypothetical protein
MAPAYRPGRPAQGRAGGGPQLPGAVCRYPPQPMGSWLGAWRSAVMRPPRAAFLAQAPMALGGPAS